MHASLKTPVLAFLFAGALISSASAGPLIDLSAEASRQAPNDQLQASAYVESTGENAQEVAKKASAAISEALAVGKNYVIKEMNVGAQHQRPVPVFAMAKGAVAMAQDMAPAPIKAGEATVSVTVSGKIEVAD